MRKLLLIGIKDLKLVFRDRAALTFMLLAPFLLTLGMGFVTGAFSGSGNMGLSQIKVVLVNQDEGSLGGSLVEVFQSAELADLIAPTVLTDPQAARNLVEADEATTAIIIPSGFSASIFNTGSSPTIEVSQIEIYKNPLSPVSTGVIQAIVEEYLSRVESGRIGAQVVVSRMLASGLVPPGQEGPLAEEVGRRQAEASQPQAFSLSVLQAGLENQPFNIMAYMAPGMALMFLMFTVSNGGRSILAEKYGGTLPRLLVSPTSSAQVLIGKIIGVYLTGVVQVMVLVASAALIFNLRWGDPVGVVILVLASVFGATGWGMLITSLARTPGQVSNIGTAVMLIFGVLGGTFIQTGMMPAWFQLLGRITPNAWGMEGFTILGMGGGLADLGEPILWLMVMGVVLFVISILLFSRRSLLRK
jgi:ABC-2 type transport system permease protein